MNKLGQFIIAFTLGTLTGVATGLLMAPDKGEKTRKRLNKNYTKAYKRTVGDIASKKKVI